MSSKRRSPPVHSAILFTLAAILALSFPRDLHAFQGDQKPAEPAKNSEPAKIAEPKSEWKGDPYLLDIDPFTRERLGPVERQEKRLFRGREFRFSSKENSDRFESNPSNFIPAVDARLIRDQSDFYPLDTCLVSGEKLGDKAVSLIHRNRLVRFSSQEHVQAFLADTAKYIADLDQAVVTKQAPKYSKRTCAVCGSAFRPEGPVDYVIGNRLIRLHSMDCAKDIERDPRKYMLWYPEKENRVRADNSAETPEGPR